MLNQSRTRNSFLLLQLQVFKMSVMIFTHMYMCMDGDMHMARSEDNLQELILFFSSTLGTELRWSGLIVSAFTF